MTDNPKRKIGTVDEFFAMWHSGEARQGSLIGRFSPPQGGVIEEFLTAILSWDYPMRYVLEGWKSFSYHGTDLSQGYPLYEYRGGVRLVISPNPKYEQPVVDVRLREWVTSYRAVLCPDCVYYWKLIPFEGETEYPQAGIQAWFRTGHERIDETEDNQIRYQNPRVDAHWEYMQVVPFDKHEPLSPWYYKKSFRGVPPPKFDEVKERFPKPVIDDRPDLIDLYWYSWRLQLNEWTFAPFTDDHQLVSNMIGTRSWGPWGAICVWDVATILYYARYGHQVYPFITQFDNFYAIQHENGFINRSVDASNRETYTAFPLNPPLFAWSEWLNYQISGDLDRVSKVLVPIIKHYEWWMTYQRRSNGLYWIDGFNEADDSPRNPLIKGGIALSATAYQALTARFIANLAREVNRKDLESYFLEEHHTLDKLVNQYFWDEQHQIYNDLNKDGKFITEIEPGTFCKHCHIFWPLIAGIAHNERATGMVAEIRNPSSFYRRNGVPSLSADSEGYRGGENGDGQYWRGAIWPPIQVFIVEGLKAAGFWDQAHELAERYVNAITEVFQKEKTIKENLAPDSPTGHGVPEFVGWSGVGPVGFLIEFFIGLEISVPNNQITWRIQRTDHHGLLNMKLGDFYVDLTCEERSSDNDLLRISVKSGGEFLLKVISFGKTFEQRITKGEDILVLQKEENA